MNKYAGRNWQASEIGPAFEELATNAISDGHAVVRLKNGEDVVVLSKRRFENLRPTPQQFIRENSLSEEASDLLDEMIDEGRRSSEAPFGI